MPKRKTGSGQYPLRLPADLRLRIEKAAKGRNISLNEAILQRLEISLQTENRFGGPRATALAEALGSIMAAVGESAGLYKYEKLGQHREWLDFRVPFDRAASAASAFLKDIRPKVDGGVPKRTGVEAIKQTGVEAVEQSAAEVERQAQRAASDGPSPSMDPAAMWDRASRRVAVEHGLAPEDEVSSPQELREKIQRTYGDLGRMLAALETPDQEEKNE